MIVRGFPGVAVQEFCVKPDLLNWAPFIGSDTRESKRVFNTEHRKVKVEDGKIEDDCREVTEERLLEMLHHSTLKEVRSFAKRLGLTGTGSKLEIIMNIKNAVQNNDEKFNKAFSKLWGCSGGWASGTCPHGVVYALKFLIRSESPRDYVDILLSMKHQPNVTIVDVANLVTAHGNRRKNGMFSPNSGMLMEPTPENFQEAKARHLDISLDWLNVQGSENTAVTGHPITGSNDHFCLFDRFHECNPQNEREVLRRVTHVRQLNGLINTQRQEQLYNVFNRDSRFLNSMTPVNHIFLFRSNIDLLNERINERNISNIAQLSSFAVTEDQFGRAIFDKTKRAPATTPTKATTTSTKQPDMSDTSLVPPAQTSEIEETLQREIKSASESQVILTDCPSSPDDDPCVFYSRPPDTSNEPRVMNTTNFPEFEELQTEEDFWIKELGLQIIDKTILEKAHWLNDRIMLAVFKILRAHPCTADIGGLQDLIPAVKYGFRKENCVHFVQIVNVRGNHWVTISNIKSKNGDVCIYDSYINLNRKGDKVSYPINVEQCACKLASSVGFFNMAVANVQQQKGGAACGLYAVSNTIALCFGEDPLTLRWNQEVMGANLMRLFVDRDFATFLASTSKRRDPPIEKYLFEWVCWVHCHWASPDDGKLMGQCKKCKRWFHRDCEKGNFDDPEWKCIKCTKREEEAKRWKEARRQEREKCFIKLREVSKKNEDHQDLVAHYDKLNEVAFNGELPPGNDNVGFVGMKEFNNCTGEKKCHGDLGITYSHGEFMFIIIFPETHTDKLTIFKTLIHEMVHAKMIKQNIRGRSHGKEFKSLGKQVSRALRSRLQEFHKPYCDMEIDETDIFKVAW